MMNPADDIQWEEYWNSASDGTCRTPSEKEIDELISQQLAKEIVVDSTDNMEMVRIDYGPEVNFCCDEELTKTFQITMTDKPLVYAWSFVNGDWIHNDSSNN